MTSERLQTLSIFGKEFPIRTAEAAERVEEIAAHVDGCMRDVAGSMAVKDPFRVAVLASLNIAGEARAAREDREQVEHRLRGLVDRLDRALVPGPEAGLEA